jgi:hypothetical protein
VGQSDYDKAADLVGQAVDAARPVADELAALPKPSGDQEVLTKADHLRDEGIALIERLGDAIRDEDFGRVSSLTDEINSLDDEGDGIAAGYGFKVCGKGRN